MNDNWVLLAGLTDHEAAAIEIMVNMTWRDQRCITLRRDLSLSIPEQTAQAKACRYCVIDLFSLGLRKHSPDNEVLLLQFLAGRSAVLLVRGSGSGWFDALLPLQPGQHITCLSMPYSSIALREALQKIKNANAADAQRMPAAAQPSAQQPASDAAPASSAASAEPVAPSVTAASAAGKPALSAPSPAPSPAPAPTPAPMPAWRRALQLAERLHAERSARNTQSLHSKRQPAAAPQPAPPPAHEPIAPTASQAAAHRTAHHPASRPGNAQPPARSIAALPSQTEAAESLSVAPPTVPLTAQALGLRTGAWAKLLRALPALKDVALADFIGQTLQGPLGEGLQLWRIGPVVCLVHVRQGWLATAAPPATLQKMVHTTGLLQSVERHPLPAEQLHSAAQKFFGQNFQRLQKPLDVLAWDLLSESLDGLTLQAQDDFTLQLRCFPNFPHLTRSDPLDVQLAAICARIPQSVHDLLRAFPRHEQAVLRFVALSVACGLAVVLEDAPAAAQKPSAPGPDQAAAAKPPAPATPAAAPAPASGAAKARRGFFKSLLDKLF
ncbi:hypothetical protein EBQ34_08385 [Vandammella animalimorsus]|uniref:Uncharacterized protein n=1 Tax=Vandammella animalimorsus TaxID=2029117 RepID=A0A3M6RHZ0_9BURK|nr:hypothetical protein [Vandammella animalimorsus]RMX14916.1 hypothetical protein EBQ34_08385 [Vandammella animalimorsus]